MGYEMGRLHQLRVAALNISVHPHDGNQYIRLLRRAVRMRAGANYYGSRVGRFASCRIYSGNSVFYGTFALYTDIDPAAPWFNIDDGQEASDEEAGLIVIPRNLRPEFKSVPYVFFRDHHKLFYSTADLSARSAEKLVGGVLTNPRVRGRLDQVSVNLEQDTERLEEMLRLEDIRSITIQIDRPNPDDFGDLEERVVERLKSNNAKRLTEALSADRGESLTPDDETRQLGEIACSNGEVILEGYNENGIKVRRHSKQSPVEMTSKFDPEKTAEVDEIFRLGTEFLEER